MSKSAGAARAPRGEESQSSVRGNPCISTFTSPLALTPTPESTSRSAMRGLPLPSVCICVCRAEQSRAEQVKVGLAGWSHSARVGKTTSLIASSRRAVARGGASLCSGEKKNPLHSFIDHGLGSGHAVGRRDGLVLIGWHARHGREVVSIGLARRLGRQCGRLWPQAGGRGA